MCNIELKETGLSHPRSQTSPLLNERLDQNLRLPPVNDISKFIRRVLGEGIILLISPDQLASLSNYYMWQ